MGDRGNVNVREDSSDKGVFLYSHWGGTELPRVVRQALDRGKNRWHDTPYLTRIIFCEMLLDTIPTNRGSDGFYDELVSETGFGISTEECDPGHPTIVIDVGTQTVTVRGDRVHSFRDYVKLTIE